MGGFLRGVNLQGGILRAPREIYGKPFHAVSGFDRLQKHHRVNNLLYKLKKQEQKIKYCIIIETSE